SGFFYPLYLAGQGKLTSSGEIIDLIIRDESIHGVYVGMLAQEILESLPEKEKKEAVDEVYSLVERLVVNEDKYTEELYEGVGLADEVKDYVRYNVNKALMNLGFEPLYTDVTINPIVENGIRTNTKQHDFFSKKGNGYVKALNVERMQDEDFMFD